MELIKVAPNYQQLFNKRCGIQLDSHLKNKKVGSKHYTINQDKLQVDQRFK